MESLKVGSGLGLGCCTALLAGAAIWACNGGSVTPGPDDASSHSVEASTEAAPPESGVPDTAAPTSDGATDAAVSDATPDAADAALTPPEPLCVRTPAQPCLARLDLGTGKLPYYRSQPLELPQPAIQDLVLVQHGNSRNAWDYYDTIARLATTAAPAHTAVLAPHFQILGDTPPPGDLYWVQIPVYGMITSTYACVATHG